MKNFIDANLIKMFIRVFMFIYMFISHNCEKIYTFASCDLSKRMNTEGP